MFNIKEAQIMAKKIIKKKGINTIAKLSNTNYKTVKRFYIGNNNIRFNSVIKILNAVHKEYKEDSSVLLNNKFIRSLYNL